MAVEAYSRGPGRAALPIPGPGHAPKAQEPWPGRQRLLLVAVAIVVVAAVLFVVESWKSVHFGMSRLPMALYSVKNHRTTSTKPLECFPCPPDFMFEAKQIKTTKHMKNQLRDADSSEVD